MPPTINLDDPDDALDLDVAALKARHLDIPAALWDALAAGSADGAAGTRGTAPGRTDADEKGQP